MQIFLSYHSPDREIARQLKEAIESARHDVQVFMDVESLRRGHFWQPALYEAISNSHAFIILVGNKIGDWQRAEYYEAHDKKQKNSDSFTLLPIILTDRSKSEVPNLPGLAQLNWIEASEPTSPGPLAEILSALRSEDTGKKTLPWQVFNPFRGLLALEEQDSDFFFGRDDEINKVVRTIQTEPNKIITLVGNSGVGKSSLVQAGIIPKLKHGLRGGAGVANSASNSDGRTWAYLTMKPGDQPLRALCTAFVDLWFQGSTDPERIRQRNAWSKLLASGDATFSDLIETTCKKYSEELSLPAPQHFFLYIDQGEELYSQSGPEVAALFSSVIAEALSDPRLRVMMSLRADYYGRLQQDRDLFARSVSVDVPPMGRDGLRAVLEGPTKVLGAKFESPEIVAHLVAQAWQQPAALPLLADLMTGLWKQMQERCDGYIRPIGPVGSMRLEMLLTARADAYLAINAKARNDVRRLFTMKLVSLQSEGEPLRRLAYKSECSDGEWQVAEELAGPEWRLLVLSQQDGSPVAEVGHEVLLREWTTLRTWLSEEREFLAWKTEAERQLHRFESTPDVERSGVLLDDWLLKQAKRYMGVQRSNIGKRLLKFVRVSEFRPSLLKAGLLILSFHFMIKVMRIGNPSIGDTYDSAYLDYFDILVIVLVVGLAAASSIYILRCLTLVRASYSILFGIVIIAFTGTALLSDWVAELLGVSTTLRDVRSWFYHLFPDPAQARSLMIRMAEWIFLLVSLLPLLFLYARPRFDTSSPSWRKIAVAGGASCGLLFAGSLTLSAIGHYQTLTRQAAVMESSRQAQKLAQAEFERRRQVRRADVRTKALIDDSPHLPVPPPYPTIKPLDRDMASGAAPDPAAFSAIFAAMTQKGKDAAEVAKLQALERGQSGTRVSWRTDDTGHFGYFVPGTVFKRGAHNCRNFLSRITLRNDSAMSGGVSCRSIDGTWGDVASGDSFFSGDYIENLNQAKNKSISPRDDGNEKKRFELEIGSIVYFQVDSADILPEAEETLRKQATWLTEYPRYSVSIEGHSDERGTREYNLFLANKRAAAVRDFLVRQGITVERIRTMSYGKERPVAVCNDISCWSQNRRVQTILEESISGETSAPRPPRSENSTVREP